MMKYRVIICGGRDFNGSTMAYKAISNTLKNISKEELEIVEGGAKGADRIGREWAIANNVTYKTFPADWENNGKAAGHIRNAEMAEYGTHCIAFWDGVSRGTKNMIDTASKKGLRVKVVNY